LPGLSILDLDTVLDDSRRCEIDDLPELSTPFELVVVVPVAARFFPLLRFFDRASVQEIGALP
jgi:hypothetical protein